MRESSPCRSLERERREIYWDTSEPATIKAYTDGFAVLQKNLDMRHPKIAFQRVALQEALEDQRQARKSLLGWRMSKFFGNTLPRVFERDAWDERHGTQIASKKVGKSSALWYIARAIPQSDSTVEVTIEEPHRTKEPKDLHDNDADRARPLSSHGQALVRLGVPMEGTGEGTVMACVGHP